jgi:hypothetical protein
MIDCPYYRVDTLRFRSREIRSDQQVANVKPSRSPWRAHPHSPVTKVLATETVGGPHALRCDGLLAKCQVELDKRGDIEPLP